MFPTLFAITALWDQLKALAAADSRITIIEANLDRAGLLSLYACCDVFVSLHRCEGLGLSPAEALQLGLDAIATDYGGNTDFCDGPLAHPVPCQLIAVQEGEYFYHHDLVWAEADVAVAARLMAEVAARRRQQPSADPSAVQAYRDRLSAARVGSFYRRRLDDLWSRREQIQAYLDCHHPA